MTPQEYTELKASVAKWEREAHGDEAILEQTKRRLRLEFSCASIKDAKSLLTEMEQELDDEECELGKQKEKFDAKYADKLQD